MRDRKTVREKNNGKTSKNASGKISEGNGRAMKRAGMPRAIRRCLGAAWLMAGALAAQAQGSNSGDHGMPRAFEVEPAALPLPAAVRGLPVVLRDPGSGAALGDDRLEKLRGGTETPWSDMRLGGTVGNNAATHVVTGANTITDGAFANASGLPMVIQNSGANVLIQNATIVNVQIR
jgi:hypothetical protein